MGIPTSIKFEDHVKSNQITSVPLLDVGRGNDPLKQEFMDAFAGILETGRFIGGPHCQQLEQSVAEICDAQFGMGCASGSDALLLALMAIGIEPGDEVICPSFTFFATASAIDRLGGVPVFADIEPGTFNIDPAHVESLVTDKTKAIIPVHLFGQCADMDAIMEIASRHNLRVIEDCAQSIGATWNDQPCGAIGDIGCFSFYPTKNLGGFGDGGMLSTNDAELADRVRLLANHGMRPRYYHSEVGINSRLDSIQAAMLGVKIRHLDSISRGRQQNAANYDRLFAESGLSHAVSTPVCDDRSGHVWNQYTVRIEGSLTRDEVRQQLADKNIGSEIYYPVPLHQQECFEKLGYQTGDLPETEKAAACVLSLPIFPELNLAEQGYVVKSLLSILLEREPVIRRAA
ncbi:DegT/DnrJ/EryC1/StrS family aminotransferase [Mariniblastus fucicola]|uniref:Aminotransferase n=1 Tax=Mariniblastus fucicola TaxID=980251 RepID=A0A5B9P4X7_9BACT|nr:DegT/DnrJ/EryC1/StrS family aminotransferase [Mariniblastus fucicola]QEG21657.1 Aminotransferase [Mariniblastus fucicola]